MGDRSRADRERERRRRARGAPAPRRRRSRGPVVLGAVAAGVVVLAGAALGATLWHRDDGAAPGGATAAQHRAVAAASGGVPSSPAGAGDPGAPTPTPDPRDSAAWPRAGAAARRTRVPILMYHVIAPAPAGTAYPALWVRPSLLRAQVAALRSAGFVGVTLGEVWAAWHGAGRLPARPVVLSFDDGDLSQVLGAGPVLKDAGWPGVLNLAANHLGPKGLPMWGARRLIAQRWEIDSHTIDHLDVTTLGAAALAHQIAGSRVLIRRRLGVDPRFFCYPAGRNDAAAQAEVRRAGYLAATTVDPGRASSRSSPFTLPRIRVEPTTTPAALVAQAAGRAAPPAGSGGGA